MFGSKKFCWNIILQNIFQRLHRIVTYRPLKQFFGIPDAHNKDPLPFLWQAEVKSIQHFIIAVITQLCDCVQNTR